eukprot:163018_1
MMTTYYLLVKAINKHQTAISEYKDKLFCKYFDVDYNMIKNEPITIKHILSIVVYADLSAFCTEFRTTYRQLKEDINETNVIKRHTELYWYAKTLYESVQFYGNSLKSTLSTVYHGLSIKMCFEEFKTYFNSPISTTTSRKAARLFTKNNNGIVLSLKCGIKESNDISKIPKYLSVSWISDFPGEEEQLFYGSHVVLTIFNIMECKNKKFIQHDKELSVLNKFQDIIQNEYVQWNENNEDIKHLVSLIKKQRS